MVVFLAKPHSDKERLSVSLIVQLHIHLDHRDRPADISSYLTS